MTLKPTTSSTPLMSEEEMKARNKNNVIIGMILIGIVVAFYAVTLVRLQDNVAKRLVLDKEAAAMAKPALASPAHKNGAGEKGKAH